MQIPCRIPPNSAEAMHSALKPLHSAPRACTVRSGHAQCDPDDAQCKTKSVAKHAFAPCGEFAATCRISANGDEAK
ncbi:unnamed protein product [Bursaphelenchus xylophilus]|uniref:(pine wood nematode) hypothetical protein n=1 Tax=Bursaphelenchus xylophilus TaxID=6326 RepID=A0A1I7S185_BURXY|nr:unnamed protein product [Bursaphelenchus xylophilus]CAG9080102.1 unnamed protein product [Bursaphelenchus xylophilus]